MTRETPSFRIAWPDAILWLVIAFLLGAVLMAEAHRAEMRRLAAENHPVATEFEKRLNSVQETP